MRRSGLAGVLLLLAPLSLLAACGHEASPRAVAPDPVASARASEGTGARGPVVAAATGDSDAAPAAASSAPPPTAGSLGTNTSSGRVGTPGPRVIVPRIDDGCAPGDTGCAGPIPLVVVTRVLRSGIAAMRACYEAGLAKDPALAGELKLVFVLRTNGSVESVGEEGTFADPAVAKCVFGVVKRLEFPEPPGGKLRIRHPVRFEQ